MSKVGEFLGALNALRRRAIPRAMEVGEFGQRAATEAIPMGVAYRAAARENIPAFAALADEVTPEQLVSSSLRRVPQVQLSPLAQMAADAVRAADADRFLRSGAVFEEVSPVAREIYDLRRAGRDVPEALMLRAEEIMRGMPDVDVVPVTLPGDVTRVRGTPEQAVDVPGVHFSPQELTATDPRRYGTGIAGEEAARLTGADFVRPRTYFYVPEGDPLDVVPESGLGAVRHLARLRGLYPLERDPLRLGPVARTLHRMPYEGGKEWNKGMVDPASVTALEEIIKRLGYSGYTSEALARPGTKGSALSFERVPVEVIR